ncbi:MFS family permease [Microbacterium terrae]|uniref:Inner membrane protein YbjJ n=1 Tax=Microbacterium terrae TaxID=69369 RepID=A0A0M2HL47_9MICO|nr:MFS transporter [Microbacterium terrae]KJL45625.1 Inner membrane protein YbjJ [Microbacterium terrae]MBP1078030.1 MFS family permease [Microbacterium terrae]GLK00199.1 MFS transporter [Microbacterium terrae]
MTRPLRDDAPTAPGSIPRVRAAVTAAYAAQGLGYAVIVTSLPALKERQGVDDTIVTIIVLGVAIAAAAGSVLANTLAVRFGSRVALVAGLALQGIALPLIALPTPFALFIAAFALFGVGLGCVDAAVAMQGVAVQRLWGKPLLGGFFAALTAAAIAGALLVSAVTLTATAAGIALATAGVIALGVAGVGIRLFARDPLVDPTVEASPRGPLPRAGIWAFGFVILAVFVADSAVSTWSTVYLHDDLGALAWVAPLGYAAYQAAVLLTRLATDRLQVALGRARLVAIAAVISAVGCAVVALLPAPAAAVVGFALAGIATGVLVPVTFGASGDLEPARSDQVIARVNLFNYAGAILGAVVVGVLADGPGIGPAFLLPAVALLAVLFVVPRFRVTVASSAKAASEAR